MTSNALSRRTVIVSGLLSGDVAAPAQIVELLLNQSRDFRIRLVTVEAQALPTVVNVVVMAFYAAYRSMRIVGKSDRQQRRCNAFLMAM